MSFEARRTWIFFIIAIFAVSGYLYFTVQENRTQLQNHSFRSLNLTKNNLLNSWENYKVREIEQQDKSDYQSEVSGVLEELLNQMPPSNFFNHVVLTDTTGGVLYATGDIPLNEIPDNTKVQDGKLGATQSKLSISSTDYQAFQVPVKLTQSDSNFIFTEKNLHLYGLISQDNFNEAGLKISFTLLYVLFTLVVLLIISFPVIRVVGMARGDTLLQSHVYQIGLSVVLLAIFIGYTISYLMSRSEIVQDQHETVENVTNTVTHLHQHELNNFTKLLESYFLDQNSTLTNQMRFKELIEIDSAGIVQRFKEKNKKAEAHDTTLAKLPKLSNRYYFRNADTENFLIGSHYSYLESGDQEGVISQKFKIASTNTTRDSTDVVRAVTFSFDRYDSLDTKINAIGLRYLIINASGDIYYQSPSIKTNIPNINSAIEIEQWNQINALMANNDDLEGSLEIPVSFEGQPYIAHLSPLNITSFNPKNELWMLTFRDQNLRYLRSYAIFLYSTAGIAILVVSFLLMSLIFSISGRASHFLNIKQFSYSWFRPSKIKEKNYLFLIFIIVIHILFFFNILLNDFHNFWFIVILFCETVACIALYRFILLSSFLSNWRRLRYWTIPVLISLVIAGFVVLACLTGSLTGDKSGIIISLLIFQIIGFFSIALLQYLGWFKSRKADQTQSKPGTETIYSITFTLWVVLIGIMSGYTIHHSAFHFEDTLWQKAATINHNDRDHAEDVSQVPWTIQDSILDEMEYQRRNWLSNISGINYPVIKRYIYTEKSNIIEAFHQHEEAGEHRKDIGSVFLLILLFFISASLLFLIIRTLTKKVFLIDYWDFNYKVGRLKNVYPKTYLVALDQSEGIQFLESKFLHDKSYDIIDLAGTALPPITDIKNDRNDGYLLLSIEYVFQTTKELSGFTAFICMCEKQKKFVLLCGSKSVKELFESETQSPDADYTLTHSKWLDSVSHFSTIILPIDYDNSPIFDQDMSLDHDLMIRLEQEIRFGPHSEELERLLREEILDDNSSMLSSTTYESFVLTVQRYSKAYYQNIWEKLSFREKQMVYNYSREGFVNYRNFDILTELLQKGVFRMDYHREVISLFNQSFTNFAVQAPTQKMLSKFKHDKKVNGNVTELRNAVLTFIFLAILGLSIVSPDMLNRYVGALSGGLAILSSLASILNKYTFKLPFISSGEES